MKSNDQINSDAFSSWVDVQDRREATPCRGQTADPPRRLAGEPNACVHLEATPPGEPSAGINQSRRSDVSRSWYDSALSWLMTAIFEGFAAYAEAMSPGLPDPSCYTDHTEAGTDTHPHQPDSDRRKNKSLFPAATEIDSCPAEIPKRHAPPGWFARCRSSLLNMGPGFHHREKKPTGVKVETFDTDKWGDEDFDWRRLEKLPAYRLPDKW